jgi:hypothetical protein
MAEVIRNGFATRYEVHILAEPGGGGANASRQRSGARLEIVPMSGERWRFWLSGLGAPFSGLFATPSPDHLLVVVQGEGAIANARSPGSSLSCPGVPLVGVARVPGRDILLVWGYYDMFALDPEGIVWHTRMIFYGDVVIEEVTPERVRYIWQRGQEQDGTEQPWLHFELEVATGHRVSDQGSDDEIIGGRLPWP